jgi:1,4-dihydroxy-2-naphthoate octaprenyltransferase
MRKTRGVPLFKTWFLALRPWSYTAAFVPVALGAVLAASQGYFDFGLFALTLVGGVAMQAGTNLINTYGDYCSGVDTVESAPTCPQLVTGALQPRDVRMAGIACFAFATAVGIWLTYLRGWPVTAAGLVGLAGGYCYTAGISYKYKGFGSIFVFFLMGPLMAWPSYFIQTGQFSWLPVWASLPVGFLVSGILHANDLRDMTHDRRAGIRTLALYFGLRNSVLFYYGLYTAAYVCLLLLVLTSALPWSAALPLVLLPTIARMFTAVRQAAAGSCKTMALLEASAAKFHFQFGLLLVAGLVIHPLVTRWSL